MPCLLIQHLLYPLCRLIRPDKLVLAMQMFVMEEMGRNFIEPPPFDLDRYANGWDFIVFVSPTFALLLTPFFLCGIRLKGVSRTPPPSRRSSLSYQLDQIRCQGCSSMPIHTSE